MPKCPKCHHNFSTGYADEFLRANRTEAPCTACGHVFVLIDHPTDQQIAQTKKFSKKKNYCMKMCKIEKRCGHTIQRSVFLNQSSGLLESLQELVAVGFSWRQVHSPFLSQQLSVLLCCYVFQKFYLSLSG